MHRWGNLSTLRKVGGPQAVAKPFAMPRMSSDFATLINRDVQAMTVPCTLQRSEETVTT